MTGFTALTGAGHTIAPDGPATAAALQLFDSFVVADAARMASGSEIAALADFVSTGGLLLVLQDRESNYANTLEAANGIRTGVGSSIRYTGATMNQNMFLEGGVFATTSPNNVAGAFFSGTPGRRVEGGTALTRGGTTAWNDSQRAAAAAYIH